MQLNNFWMLEKCLGLRSLLDKWLISSIALRIVRHNKMAWMSIFRSFSTPSKTKNNHYFYHDFCSNVIPCITYFPLHFDHTVKIKHLPVKKINILKHYILWYKEVWNQANRDIMQFTLRQRERNGAINLYRLIYLGSFKINAS